MPSRKSSGYLGKRTPQACICACPDVGRATFASPHRNVTFPEFRTQFLPLTPPLPSPSPSPSPPPGSWDTSVAPSASSSFVIDNSLVLRAFELSVCSSVVSVAPCVKEGIDRRGLETRG